MASSKSKETEIELFSMQFYEERLKTFVNWPFDKECSCTPEKMAAAGFYYTPTENEPDLVQCFFCLKELDGWEPTDDPLEEHKSHASHCPYLKFASPDDILIEDQLKLILARYNFVLSKKFEKRIEEIKHFANEAKAKMSALM